MKDKDQLLLEQAYDQIREGTLETIGHTMLDIAGLIPGVGEAADITNVLWYCAKQQYLLAALSLVSCIPVIGDVIGKGTKASLLLTKASSIITKAKALLIDNKTLISKVLKKAEENQKIAPHIPKIREALNTFVGRKTQF